MKIVVDMNLSPQWVAPLNAAGFDAQHWSAIGAVTATDEEIMALAVGAVVPTHHLDFSAILAFSSNSKPSIVQIRATDLDPDKNGARVIAQSI